MSDGSGRVVVVGGGLAGMSAAMALAKHGVPVTLIEAKRRLGGRTGSFEDATSGQQIDYCQHVGMQCCTNLRKWIDWLGQVSQWQVEKELYFYSSCGKSVRVAGSMWPAPLHLSGLLWRWPDLSMRERLQVATGLLRLLRLRISEHHESMLALDWLLATGQSEGAIRKFWSTILVSALGDQIDRVTMSATHKVLVDGFASHFAAYHLWVPKASLAELFDVQARKILESTGVEVHTSAPIGKVLFKNGRCSGVQWTTGEIVEAQRVLLAVPWYRIQTLVSDCTANKAISKAVEFKSIDRVSALEASPITGVHMWWDRTWLDSAHGILVDRLCQWVFAGQDRPTQDGEVYYQVVISGSRQLPPGNSSALLEQVVRDLREVFPKAKEARFLRGKVVTDPQAVFSVAPGHFRARLAVDEFASAGLWVCGDWTKTGWPATMEGAIRSGFMAAESILGNQVSIVADDLPKSWLTRRIQGC